MWFITVMVGGLMLTTVEPFWSEEACILAAKVAGIGQAHYTCAYVPPMQPPMVQGVPLE